MSRDEAGLGAAQEHAGVSKFFRCAKALGGDRTGELGARFFVADVAELGLALGQERLTRRVDALGQYVVDRDVVRSHLEGERFAERRQAGARRGGAAAT